MKFQFYLVSSIALAGLAAAQQIPDGLPWPKGVYVRSGNEWIGLPANPLVPFREGSARQLLGFGESDAIAEMPGPHALIQLGNAKPTFFLRGIPQAYGIHLVRTEQRDDYRRLRMPRVGDYRQFVKFRQPDLVEMEMRPLGDDVVQVTPRGDLKPGEYALISQFQPNVRQIRASFEFGVNPR